MHKIPDITVDCEDIIVDEVRTTKRFLRPLTWSVFWRSVHNADLRGLTVLTRDVCSGVGALGQRQFQFTIDWREDLRRRLLCHDETMGEAVSDAVSEAVSEAVSIATSTAASFAEFTSDSQNTTH
ncbi:MAG: hypothetical protein AB8B57_04720 [Congregibacter sp.]